MYNPRRIAERAMSKRKHNEESDPLTLSSRNISESDIWDKDHKFVDEFWDEFSSGKHFIGFDDSLHSEEKDDKYLVFYDDPGLKQDDVKVDFNQKENELVIHIDHADFTETSSNSKTYQSAMKFDKTIKVDEIKAEIDDNGIQLVLPKRYADNEHIHHVAVTCKPALYSG